MYLRPCIDKKCGHLSSTHPGSPCEICGCRATWQPHEGPQERFITCSATEVLYGGQAGGGKSGGLIAKPLYYIQHRDFRSLILRRDTPQLADLISKSELSYPANGGRAVHKGDSVIWTFKSGARVWMTHCQHEDDVARFDGQEFQLVEFDELTHFTEKQYRGIRARIRSPNKQLPRYTRSTTNPGGDGHAWVFARFGPWLNPEYVVEGLPPRFGPNGQKLPPAASGVVLHYVRDGDTDRYVPKGTLDSDGNKAQGRTFIAARLEDNPSIGNDYKAALSDLDPVRRAQLKDGDWLASYSSGSLFQAGWFDIVDARPSAPAARIRIWDRAATKPSVDNPDPDWTRGLLLSRDAQGTYFCEDMASTRDRPAAVDALMKTTAELDGKGVPVVVFQDPGSAGVSEADAMVRNLAGWNVRVIKIGQRDGDKITRARPASAQAERRNIKLVRGMWNKAFLDELQAFPTPKVHDDQVDVLSTGVSVISPSSAAARFALLAQL